MALRVLRIAGVCCLATAVVESWWLVLLTGWSPSDAVSIPLFVIQPLIGGLVFTLCIRSKPKRADGCAVGAMWYLMNLVLAVLLNWRDYPLDHLAFAVVLLIPLALISTLMGYAGGAIAVLISRPLSVESVPVPQRGRALGRPRPWHVGVGLGVVDIVVTGILAAQA